MALAIELSEEQSRVLAEAARQLNVPKEALAAAAIRDLLSRPSADFEAAASNVLAKNAELYRRLA
jgi:predicted transcriptional regulator